MGRVRTLGDVGILFYEDRLRSDDLVNIAEELSEPLKAIELALSSTVNVESGRRAVLVTCDLGINRSPALVLAALLQSGLNLRDAYRCVLRVRPKVDPLPPYRRGLQDYEQQLHGISTVADEPFTMHISQLLDINDGDDSEQFEKALARRVASIKALVGEEGDPQTSDAAMQSRSAKVSGRRPSWMRVFPCVGASTGSSLASTQVSSTRRLSLQVSELRRRASSFYLKHDGERSNS